MAGEVFEFLIKCGKFLGSSPIGGKRRIKKIKRRKESIIAKLVIDGWISSLISNKDAAHTTSKAIWQSDQPNEEIWR